MTSQTEHGLFLVDTVPQRDTQALANQIVARIERDFALEAAHGPRIVGLPVRFYERRRDTPIAVLRRVLYSLYFFACSA